MKLKGNQDIYIRKHRLNSWQAVRQKSSSLLHTNSRWDCVTAKLIPLIWGWGPLRGFKIRLKWSWGLKRLLCFWLEWWMDEWISHTNVRGTIISRVLQIFHSSESISLSGVTTGLRRILLLWVRDECCSWKFSTLWRKEHKLVKGPFTFEKTQQRNESLFWLHVVLWGLFKIPWLHLHWCTWSEYWGYTRIDLSVW